MSRRQEHLRKIIVAGIEITSPGSLEYDLFASPEENEQRREGIEALWSGTIGSAIQEVAAVHGFENTFMESIQAASTLGAKLREVNTIYDAAVESLYGLMELLENGGSITVKSAPGAPLLKSTKLGRLKDEDRQLEPDEEFVGKAITWNLHEQHAHLWDAPMSEYGDGISEVQLKFGADGFNFQITEVNLPTSELEANHTKELPAGDTGS